MKILTATAMMLLLAGTSFAASQADFDKAYAAAEAARQEAAKMKNEWRDTAKMLRKAKKLANTGELDTAIKMAKAADFQGKMAVKQTKAQANAGNPSYLYN